MSGFNSNNPWSQPSSSSRFSPANHNFNRSSHSHSPSPGPRGPGPEPGYSGGTKRPREPSPSPLDIGGASFGINPDIFEAEQDHIDAVLFNEHQGTTFPSSSNSSFHAPQSQSQGQNQNQYQGQGYGQGRGREYQNHSQNQSQYQNGQDPWSENKNKPYNSRNLEHSENQAGPSGVKSNSPQNQNQKPNGPELVNFFDPSKPMPVVTRPVRNIGEVGAPLPKLPKQAHYNLHNKEEECQYVNEFRPLHKPAIPAFDDSDSEDEDNSASFSARRVRGINLKEEVFTKYEFGVFNVNNQNLAAYQQRKNIIEAIENNRVTIIDGFTGCGKTTQVPQFIIDRHAELRRPCNVIVTQPRRLAAVSVARRVCEERGWPVGTVVGYQVGMEKNTCPDTLVTYMTTGVLLQKLIRLKSLKHWTHIIVDEVHERDLHTDLLLLFIKKILLDDVKGKEKHVKLILMSATLDSKKFSEYFPTQKNVQDEMIETPVIKIPTNRRFQVEEVFLDQIVYDSAELDELSSNMDESRAAMLPDICNYAVKTIVYFDTMEREESESSRSGDRDSKELKFSKGERGSVLVFLPGLQEIKFLLKSLQDENRRYTDTNGGDPDHYKWDVVPLHSSITNEEQAKVFATPRAFRRKIILSTNIAESSITVPDIVYVIDFCLTKSNCVDPRTNFSCLRTCWASVNQCIQRKGRTGRVRDGKVYRMVPKKFFAKELRQESEPDMLKSALEYVVLQVKTLNMGSPAEMLCLALDAPPVSGIERAVANLKEVGAMTVLTTKTNVETGVLEMVYDTCDGDVTFLGEVMSSLPISPQCSRLIMLGHCFGVLKECVIIAAGLSAKSPFSTPFNKQLESYLQKLKWGKKSYSDCFAILYAYRAWQRRHGEMDEYIGHNGFNSNLKNEKQWGRQRFVQISQMREIRSLTEDIEERLRQKGVFANPIQVESNPDSDDIPKEIALMLKIAIAGAFYPNYFHRHRPEVHTYERERSKEVAGHDLFSTVYYRNFPSGHQGILYGQHVANALSYGLSVPHVKFEGQKVFCIFDGSGARIGPICEGVYRAIKKRQIREPLEFKLLWKEDEKDEVQRQLDRRNRRHYRRCPAQTALPGVGTSRINVVVTHAESPSQFWVISSKHVECHDALASVINNNLTNVPLSPRRLHVGALVLAPFEQQYFRARIQAVNHNVGIEQCLVYFIDYGNSDWVSISALQDIAPTMTETKVAQRYTVEDLPGLAVECRLSETKPAVIHGSIWPDAAVRAFKKFVGNMRELEMRIFAIDKSIILGELLEIQTGTARQHEMARCNFNEWLTSKNFADKAPEPYTAILNYKARTRFELMQNDREQIDACNKQQIADPFDCDFLDPPEYGKTPCALKGPYSPLELDFQSLCHSSSSKQVTVDNYSVNSVILDHEPTAPTSRLLVASSINIQDKSGRVVARETTMMPATPGLLALMSLVFAPKAELRTNVGMQRYTGVLCGLGTDPEQEPIYMDHDMEVVFDTEIDDKDIEIINFIRYDMNVILRENSGANNASVQKDLWNQIFTLLKRTRKGVDEEVWPQESYVWDRIPAACIKKAPRNMFPVQPLDIFHPHATIHLSEEAPSNISWDYAI